LEVGSIGEDEAWGQRVAKDLLLLLPLQGYLRVGEYRPEALSFRELPQPS
jgi:hypothetical protein